MFKTYNVFLAQSAAWKNLHQRSLMCAYIAGMAMPSCSRLFQGQPQARHRLALCQNVLHPSCLITFWAVSVRIAFQAYARHRIDHKFRKHHTAHVEFQIVQTVGPETLVFNLNQTPGNYPKEDNLNHIAHFAACNIVSIVISSVFEKEK